MNDVIHQMAERHREERDTMQRSAADTRLEAVIHWLGEELTATLRPTIYPEAAGEGFATYSVAFSYRGVTWRAFLVPTLDGQKGLQAYVASRTDGGSGSGHHLSIFAHSRGALAEALETFFESHLPVATDAE